MTSPSFCPFCGAAVTSSGTFCAACGKPLPQAAAPQTQPPPPPPQPAPAAVLQGTARCPFCGSTQVQAAKRGWKWTTGMVGSGKIVFTCLQCGKTFDQA